MKRNILLACLVFIFVGCEANKQQPEPQEAKKEIIVEEVKPVIAEEKIEKPKKKSTKRYLL